MYQPQSIFTEIALAAITGKLEGKNFQMQSDVTAPPELLNIKRACFVSLHLTDGTLRGCIGTLEPYELNLAQEISRNAVSAAFHDGRFSPVTRDEMESIELSVDVLTVPEQIQTFDDLDPQIYGVIVTDENHHRAVLLPSIPSIDTIEQQIEIVKRKAGLTKVSNDKLTFYRFTSNRYH